METTNTTSTTWKVDAGHSEIGFKVKHLMITNVRGTFDQFDITAVSTQDDFEHVQVHFSADVNSVNTNSEQRDGHLKGADFFDGENHPKIEFVSKGMKKTSGNEFVMEGDLTIRGLTKHIALDVELTGVAKDPWGQTKAGFTIEGKINRKDFGLAWNAPTETGGLLVSEEVKVHCEIQMVKQA
jgi:polyisoprenoid-binding protein YceI